MVYRVSRLHLVAGGPSSGNYVPELMQQIRSRLSGKQTEDSKDVLYISRRNARARHIVNEKAVLQALKPLNVEPLVLENNSFARQVDLFGAARVVIAPHGAGLTNMLWMRPGSRVIEVRREQDAHNNCYFTLAAALGLDYRYSLASPRRVLRRRLRRDLEADVHSVLAATSPNQ